ncbi:hypothetical protein BN440_3915 [Erwinia amylovora MR1]|nr:hypothetical protein BN440_3915 [Erwinia amylovora MR1]
MFILQLPFATHPFIRLLIISDRRCSPPLLTMLKGFESENDENCLG